MTPAQEVAVADALRMIAAASVKARGRTTGLMQRLPADAGAELLTEVEYALSTLIVRGAVPSPRTPIEPPGGLL